MYLLVNNLLNKSLVQNIYMCKNDEYKDFDKELI